MTATFCIFTGHEKGVLVGAWLELGNCLKQLTEELRRHGEASLKQKYASSF